MRIYVAGHKGMVGRAIIRRLGTIGPHRLITATHAQLDLTNQAATQDFIRAQRPDIIILAAARVGGIMANTTQPADFIYGNLMMASNVIHAAHHADVPQLLQLGSSCIYPQMAPQPIRENALLTGPLEPTNEPYAVAKIAAIKLCESYNRQFERDYRSLMPTNLYGSYDNFDQQTAHVLPALIKRFHDAARVSQKSVTIWGTGIPRREFLHVDDLADAAIFVMQLSAAAYAKVTDPMQSHINVGTGCDISIMDLARMIAKRTGFDGTILTDPSKPDGTPRKRLDVSILQNLGWTAQTSLSSGIKQTYAWYLAQNKAGIRLRAS